LHKGIRIGECCAASVTGQDRKESQALTTETRRKR
jgi:hypothetical protein